MDVNKYAADKMKQLRIQKNLTQEELAEELKITQQQVTRYENNYRKFKQDFLFKLADYFQVSINDFFPPTTEELNTLNEYDVLFNKYKELSEEDKELINNIIDTRTKQIDKELDKS